MSGPGEFLGHYAGKIGGAISGYSVGGTPGAIIGEEAGGYLGSKFGKGLDNVIESQSRAVKQDYDLAIKDGMTPHQAIKYSLDVNGLSDD